MVKGSFIKNSIFVVMACFIFIGTLGLSSAQGFVNPTTSSSFTTLTGNLTNLAQLNDSNMIIPTNLQLLQ